MKKIAVLMMIVLAFGLLSTLVGCASSADVTPVDGVVYEETSDEKAFRRIQE